MSSRSQFLQYIDENADKFIAKLAEVVAIPSVSAYAAHRPDVFKMGKWLSRELTGLGVETREVDLGTHTDASGEELPLPPVILGRFGEDSSKKTILIYGHYDVQPAEKSDGWDTEPFTLVVDKETGRLIGRGSTDDKGPVLGWLNVLEAHKELGLDLPVNLRFCFEGMEESSSAGLEQFIQAEHAKGSDGYFHGVDGVCISDSHWQTTRTPCLTYGLRGIVFFKATISGPAQDLHSGGLGRVVHEPLTDLILLLGKLVTPDGTIIVPGVEDAVPPPSAAERAIYEKMDCTVEDFEAVIGARTTISSDKVTTLMNLMRRPSLSIHGIEGTHHGPGGKTVIPANVAGKFSIRLVPPLTPRAVGDLVEAHLRSEFAKLNSKNTLKIDTSHGGNPWLADHTHWNYVAAARATEAVYGIAPDLNRGGGSIPVTLTFAETLGVNVLLLPMGRADDGPHSTNEKLDRSNYIEGSKLLGTYLYEVAALNG